MNPIQGLHHVTAVTRDAQRNVDFYRNVLGQRLVKKTVNFDAPDAYHLYFGDGIGTPGSVLTFFAWPNIKRGVRGNGETAAVAYNVPEGSLDFWQKYLREKGISTQPVEIRFEEEVLPLEDPDGMQVELVASGSTTEIHHWQDGPIPRAHALNGFHSVTLWLDEIVPTAELLTGQMGYTFSERTANRHRFTGGPGSLARYVDILHRPRQPEDLPDEAVFGAGSIHHIAFRVPSDEEQLEYQASLRAAGHGVTPVRDRSYFHSIYFREPGRVLFEIATEIPGFTIDEPVEVLGESLKLPEWFETKREIIENQLAPLLLKPLVKVK
jgi:glyoxalase family protein